jgi:PEGA domain
MTTPLLPRLPALLAICLITFAALAAQVGVAHAQPMGKTVIVPFGVPDGRDALSPADALESDLTRRRVRLVSMHEARDRFTVRSRTPLVASESDLDILAKEAREALQHVAFGRTSAAEKSVREVIQRAERALESLNRETARARQILDACLSLVRNSLHDGKREEALDQAMRCRRLVPDLAPSDSAHPANVVGVLAEADDLLRRMRTGKLTVKSQPDTNCSVYLNGRHLGTTPFVLDRAASGEYRVQVECAAGKPGRVHTVQLGDEPTSMVVDTAFDRAVYSDPRLFLSYESERAARRFLVEHAVSVGRETRAEDVVLLRVQGDVAELVRVLVAQNRMVGRARATFTSAGFERASLSKAIAALSEGRIESEPLGTLEPEPVLAPTAAPAQGVAPAAAPAAAVASAEAAPTAEGAYPTWRKRTGYAMIPLALVFAGVGFGLDAWAQSLNSKLEDGHAIDMFSPGQQQQYDSVSAASYVGLASAPLGVAAVALLAEPRASVPWWSYTLGVVGLGLTGFGIYEVAVVDQCTLSTQADPMTGQTSVCLHKRDTQRLGILLVAASVPLISIPIFHLVRKSSASAQVSALHVPGGATLSLSGRF